jgi:hypothetical protein
MTIGQLSEPPALLLLSVVLRRFGLKFTFGLGVAAWLVRYLIFAGGASYQWVLAGIALHGICHVCLIIVIQLYLDAECPPDLRNSVQNLFAFLTLGVAMPIGLLLSQPLIRLCTSTAADGRTLVNFPQVFLAASIVLTGLMLAYWWWFQSPQAEAATADEMSAMPRAPTTDNR